LEKLIIAGYFYMKKGFNLSPKRCLFGQQPVPERRPMDVKNSAHLNFRRGGNDGVLEYWGKSMERWSNGIAVPRDVNVEQGCGTWGILARGGQASTFAQLG